MLSKIYVSIVNLTGKYIKKTNVKKGTVGCSASRPTLFLLFKTFLLKLSALLAFSGSSSLLKFSITIKIKQTLDQTNLSCYPPVCSSSLKRKKSFLQLLSPYIYLTTHFAHYSTEIPFVKDTINFHVLNSITICYSILLDMLITNLIDHSHILDTLS